MLHLSQEILGLPGTFCEHRFRFLEIRRDDINLGLSGWFLQSGRLALKNLIFSLFFYLILLFFLFWFVHLFLQILHLLVGVVNISLNFIYFLLNHLFEPYGFRVFASLKYVIQELQHFKFHFWILKSKSIELKQILGHLPQYVPLTKKVKLLLKLYPQLLITKALIGFMHVIPSLSERPRIRLLIFVRIPDPHELLEYEFPPVIISTELALPYFGQLIFVYLLFVYLIIFIVSIEFYKVFKLSVFS